MGKNKKVLRDIYFIGISTKLFWYLLLRKFFNCNIYVFDNFESSNLNTKFLQKIHKKKWITRVSEHYFAFYDSHTSGIELAETIFNKISHNQVFELAGDLYGSKETDLVFKRTMAKNLCMLISINKFILHKNNTLNTSFYINSKFKKILKDHPEIINKSISVKYVFNWETLKLQMTWLIIILAYMTHLLVKNFYKKNKNKTRIYIFS